MIKAIEIKRTEECDWLVTHDADDPSVKLDHDWCLKTRKHCLGLDSPDCPLNAIRCETCKYNDQCPEEIDSECSEFYTTIDFCSTYKPKESKCE